MILILLLTIVNANRLVVRFDPRYAAFLNEPNGRDWHVVTTPDEISMHHIVHSIEPDTPVQMYKTAWDRVNQVVGFDKQWQFEDWSPNSGNDTIVYVVDTGTDSVSGMTVSRRYVAQGAGGPDNIDSDEEGHGTSVASVIVSQKHGVAHGATLVSVRVLDKYGGGFSSWVADGLDWVLQDCAKRTKRCVVNMSLGGIVSQLIDDKVNALADSGILVVAAAGNGAEDACKSSPGGARGAFTVAASNYNDVLADFSNYGDCVDVVAPGVDVDVMLRNGNSGLKSGTSFSAPMVAAMVAAGRTPDDIRENAFPNAVYRYPGAALLNSNFDSLWRNDNDTGIPQLKIDGNVFVYSPATFGQHPDRFRYEGISGITQWASDRFACNPITPVSQNNFVLVERGKCSFAEKTYHVQQAGATVAIIVNRDATDFTSLFEMGIQPYMRFGNNVVALMVTRVGMDIPNGVNAVLSNGIGYTGPLPNIDSPTMSPTVARPTMSPTVARPTMSPTEAPASNTTCTLMGIRRFGNTLSYRAKCVETPCLQTRFPNYGKRAGKGRRWQKRKGIYGWCFTGNKRWAACRSCTTP